MESLLVDLWTHYHEPIDCLPQELHVVVRGDVPEHVHLLKEALKIQQKKKKQNKTVRTDLT